jgi:hypothetical protein
MLISLSLCKLVNVLENVIYMTSSPGGWRKLQLVMSAFNTACNSLAKVEALDTIENMEETPRGARTWYKRLFDLVGIQKKNPRTLPEVSARQSQSLLTLSRQENPEYKILLVARLIHQPRKTPQVIFDIRKRDTTLTYSPVRVYHHDAATQAVEKLTAVWEGYGKHAQPFPANVRFLPIGKYVAHTWEGYAIDENPGHRWSYRHPPKMVMMWYS